MEINNSDFGGFIVSKNVIAGKPIRYTFREKSEMPSLNGWNVYSIDDDEDYVNQADNFQVLGATSMFSIAPVMLELFEAAYGTDLCWLYEKDVHIGFYDLNKDKEVEIEEIMQSK
ncbi:DUF2185 domain-containing protein [Listeria monocytogenes]|nr:MULTISPECIES: DUF2185 domain-containing protein [Listeria]EAC3326903.1 DUF2185 domain-containing protein [Listeria monocytogenes]EAC3329945.1 DUF2185 domain-containing protein [Listeria monocytogenes]EAC4743416.1 DUF2185 domain-containing protein [Listeria monocytogenes]EAC6069202.1 DUF2185 domain-containing protein [Listeria monocytogenes]EAC7119599.1 DUF2185 domain-containing protein [Listeria monocytogenes]